MKQIFLSLLMLASVSSVFAQKADDVAQFNLETVDLGKVEFDIPATATFIVKNIGTTPLIIETASPTCGCTIGDYTKSPIAPGKEGWIKATYNAKTLGAIDKHMMVKFAGIAETKSIGFKGEVLSKEEYAKLTPGKNVEVKTKTEVGKTKTVIKTDGKKTSKSKVKGKAPVKQPMAKS